VFRRPGGRGMSTLHGTHAIVGSCPVRAMCV
jgi:hypothetical protein